MQFNQQSSFWKRVLCGMGFMCFIALATSCEDVVEVNVPTDAPRLVIDASIKWAKGSTGETQHVYLSKTGSFYSNDVPKVSGAVVQVADTQNHVFSFAEDGNHPGDYVCTQFQPVVGMTYTLTVVVEGQTYQASEALAEVPSIDSVEQRNDAGPLGKDFGLKFFYQDIPDQANYYLYQFDTPTQVKVIYDVNDDRFFANNQMFGIYFDDQLKIGDTVTFTLHGISKRYSEYMNKLLSIAGSNGGSPFQTAPATVRGNLVNTTNPDNYALGYFRLSQTDTRAYTLQ